MPQSRYDKLVHKAVLLDQVFKIAFDSEQVQKVVSNNVNIEPEIEQVWRKRGCYKFEVRTNEQVAEIKNNIEMYEYITHQAHAEGDFGYLCSSRWCRCRQ